MTVSVGVQLERNHALIDAKHAIDLYGADIITFERTGTTDSSDVTRDSYRSIKRHNTDTAGYRHDMKAYPVIFQPNAKQLEKAGLRETCDCIIYMAMLDWNNISISFEDIDVIRDTIVLRNKKFSIKEKTLTNHFADTFLNITFGLAIL